MDFPNPTAYTMLCDTDTLSVRSSCHCIKLIPCLSHPLQKKICTKALLPDLCGRVILKIMVVMVFCDLENGSRIYFYDSFVQRTTLKLQLWGLSDLTIGSMMLHLLSVTISLIFACFPLPPLPVPLFFVAA